MPADDNLVVAVRRLENPDFIPLSAPHFAGNEWKYVKECLDTECVSTAGSFVEKFEAEICRFAQARYAVACMNGTAALHVALRVVGVQPDDEVIVPTLTFIAPVNAVRYLNAEPVFMDCDRCYNIDADKCAEFIRQRTAFKDGHTYNKTSGRRISAIVPVHVFGNAARLDELASLCRERSIKIVEDATWSLGTVYSAGAFRGWFTGTIGDMGCYAFNGDKIITGGGGTIVTHSARYADEARYLSAQAKDDDVHDLHHEVGYDYRLTNLQAALGLAQLEQWPRFLEIKKNNYLLYVSRIKNIPGLKMAGAPAYARNNHWMYALQVDPERYGCSARELMHRLAQHRIQSRPVWQLNHLQRPFRDAECYRVENAPMLHAMTLNIPCSVTLQQRDIDRVTRALQSD
jgi:aminotransferase in exopolysaccharide biosynthesis